MSMNIDSNIILYYESLVSDYADTARRWLKSAEDNGEEYGYDYDENNAVDRTLNDQFIYGTDEAYVLAHAYTNGTFRWGEEVDWTTIYQDLRTDVYNELKNLLKAEGEE